MDAEPAGGQQAKATNGGPAEATGQSAATSSRAEIKQMSKAERRALQEQQRQAKQDASSKPAASAVRPAAKKSSAQISAASTSSSQPSSSNTASSASVSTPFTALNLFNHLTTSTPSSKASKSEKDVHPAVARLALQWAEFRIVGANARCISMLEAFKQIEHLYKYRSRSLTLGNAIRYLKWEIAQIPLEMDEEEAKDWLCERIDYFIRDRIVVADKVIEAHTLTKIRDGDVVMTYARSSVVESSLIEAKNQGRRFEVIVVDSRPMLEGKNLCFSLAQHDIPTTYVLLSALGPALANVNLVLLGTHALLSDGSMFFKSWHCDSCNDGESGRKPVVCCCETYKFTDRIMLDSIGGNEQGPSTALLPSAPASLFDMPSTKSAPNRPNASLSLFNLLYDVSRPDDVTCVISEAGIIPVDQV